MHKIFETIVESYIATSENFIFNIIVCVQADPDAHTTFVRLTKAYEVLKDAESRKKYDLYGEDGVKSTSQQSYHSWSYYHDNFGIYDDDPEIVTLNKADFGE